MTKTNFNIFLRLSAILVLSLLFQQANASVSPVENRSRDSAVIQFGGPGDPMLVTDSADCVIPFTRAGNLILIRGRADTTEGNFILDTGAPHLVLNITYFRNYSATTSSELETGGVTGGMAAVVKSSVDSFSFGPVRYSKLDCDLANLGHIENNKGVQILGLLGMKLFTQFEMIIDYENDLIYLHHITKKDPKDYKSEMLRDTSKYNTFPIDLIDSKLVAKATLAGKKLNFIIDTGAESNVLDSRLPNKIFENVVVSRRVVLRGTGNRKVDALYASVKNMKLGNVDLASMPVLITNLENMCYAYDKNCLDGLLGFDFLSLHRIGFNFVTRKMYIWK
jgi:predicted aspartyl protease